MMIKEIALLAELDFASSKRAFKPACVCLPFLLTGLQDAIDESILLRADEVIR
jgi:hypothetical protein